MRAAAHHMVRFMTAGMALITCREPLLISINNNLRSNFQAALRVSMIIKSERLDPLYRLHSVSYHHSNFENPWRNTGLANLVPQSFLVCLSFLSIYH